MIAVRRLTAVGAVLGLAAALTSPRVMGEPKREKELNAYRSSSTTRGPDDRRFADDLAASRFSEQSFLVYATAKGASYFALQVKPALEAPAARPRDYAVLVDTSASQAQGPLELAKQLVASLVDRLGPSDRLAIWTVSNEPKSLTEKRFKAKGDLARALKDLNDEYPSGATNLKKGLKEATDAFAADPARQAVILFLGDGKSLADPLDGDSRTAVCEEMVKKEVACFTVPLGVRPDPLNLHGLPNATGGRCVRLQAGLPLADYLPLLDKTIAAPILYPNSFQVAVGASEVYPTRLPPLRADAPTLVMGKLQDGTKSFSYRIEGSVAGKNTVVQAAPGVPAADPENFFLAGMVNQWREQKDRPALMQADRALAYAAERNQMARAELVAKAEMALDQGLYAAAAKLYKQAQQVDPTSIDARNGVVVSERMQALMEKVQAEQSREPAQKRLKAEDVRAEVRKRYRDEMKFTNGKEQVARLGGGGALVRLDEQAPEPPPAAAPAQPLAPPVAPDVLSDAKARIAVAEQQQTRVVEDAVRAATRLVETDPNGARELLKLTLDGVRNNPDLSDRIRTSLGDRLERSLGSVERRGVVVLRDLASAQELAARVAQRLGVLDLEQASEARIRERMRVFHNLMDQAREAEAYKHAQNIRQDLIAQGRAVPPAVTAAYYQGLAAFNAHQEYDLRRIREERFLATLLQVEKSHIPFPDEPPVVFPPAAEWRALTELRKARYETSNLGTEMPKRTLELRDALGRTVRFDGFDDPKTTLQEALDALATRYNLQFDVNEKAFKFEGLDDVLKKEIATPNPIPAMNASIGTILRRILSRLTVQTGATFIIRRDTIEITTGQFATAEKALRVYPAGDLVTPIPNSVNQNVVNQAATLFGFAGAVGVQIGVQLGAANAFGLGALGAVGAVGAVGALGAVGAVGALGVQLGALGAGGVALGALGVQLGALGAGGVALGAVGVQLGALGGAAGVANQLGVQLGGFQGNFQGAANLGVGGGAAGVGGGQLGQFGNLGGQFGLQGGDQSRILITLIRQVVGTPKDWIPAFDPITGRPLNQLDEGDPAIVGGDNNQVAYYPPSLALVVKGTSRIQTRPFPPVQVVNPNAMADAGPNAGRPERGERMARIGPGNRNGANDPKPKAGEVRVAAAGDKGEKKGTPPDPRKIWQDALARGVTEPGLIIAVADYLVQNRQFDHAAEFLKADLRQGIVVKPWVYQALAVALRESGGSKVDIERAETATLELDPQDAQGYLTASRAMAKDKRYDRAVAFCRQASLLEPNVPYPYAEALMYAELAKDGQAMEWAAGNLVKQEWPSQSQELHAKAHQKVAALRGELEKANRVEEARHLADAMKGHKQRDLVVKMSFQGNNADVDLFVTEPTGSTCSYLNRQTVGGGTLVGDALVVPGKGANDTPSETYAATEAFSGEYTIKVVRFRGRPLGDRAQLRIIQHQGTDEETEQLVTVDLRTETPIKVRLSNGRRTEAAYIPPPSAARLAEPAAAGEGKSDVLSELRAAADPEVTGVSRGFQGQATSMNATRVYTGRPAKDPEPSPNDRAFYQTKISSFVKNSLDVTAQTVLSADRRHVRVSLAAVAAPVSAGPDRPVSVPDPVIPGGF
jgi:tetratricopeptide (TPR) repeat protein